MGKHLLSHYKLKSGYLKNNKSRHWSKLYHQVNINNCKLSSNRSTP